MVATTAAHPAQQNKNPYISPAGPPFSSPKMKTLKSPSQVIMRVHDMPRIANGEKLRW